MKTTKGLEEQLKELPEFTLTSDQKDKIIVKLRSKEKKKTPKPLIPLITLVTSLAIVSFLFMTTGQTDSKLMAAWKQIFRPQVELTAPEAEVFTHGPYEVLGLKDEVGILVIGNQFVAEDKGRGAKLMLYFWGDSEKLEGKEYSVEAFNRFGEKITLSEGKLSWPLNNEVDQQVTSFPPFPEQGEWQLTFFVDGELHSEFITEVLPPFPNTEHYMLTENPKELSVDEVHELWIVGTENSKKEIVVKLMDQKGKILSENVFTNGGNGYHYSGNIMFPEKTTYRLMIDGEKTALFKN